MLKRLEARREDQLSGDDMNKHEETKIEETKKLDDAELQDATGGIAANISRYLVVQRDLAAHLNMMLYPGSLV